MHIQSFIIYYLLFSSDWDIRAVGMMRCELQNAFWGMKFSFFVIRFLSVFYLMETTWHWWRKGCDCVLVKMPFFTELWKGSTCSLNSVHYICNFGNLVHLADLMILHRVANSLVCECSRKEYDKSCPVFPYFMFFFKWQRFQVAWFTFKYTLYMLLPSHLPSLHLHFFLLPFFHHIVFLLSLNDSIFFCFYIYIYIHT